MVAIVSIIRGATEDDYLIQLDDGTYIVADARSLTQLDAEDGTSDGCIDVSNLVDGTSGDNIAQFSSGTGQSFTLIPGANGGDYLITLADGSVIVADARTLSQLDAEDGTSNGVIDIDSLVDGTSGDNIAQFTSGTGQSFSVAAGPREDDYLITLSAGSVIVVDAKTLSQLDAEDGTSNGAIDVDSLVDGTSADNISQFVSSTGQSFTVAPGPQEDDYLITLADGSVIVADLRTLTQLDAEDGTSNGTIDVDNLVDGTSGDNIAQFISGTGQGFTVAPGPREDDYLITLSDGSVIVVDAKTLSQLDAEDGTSNGAIDVDSLVDGTSADNISQFVSSTGQSFTVAPGPREDDYLITLADGTVIVADARTLSQLDAEDGVSNGVIDIDGLIDGTSTDGISKFIPCFTAGTLIDTKTGDVPVETLSVGSIVPTKDNGLQSIRWIGARRLDQEELQANPKLYPVRIIAGALGQGLPTRDLLVSRQHRMLARSKISERMFGQSEVLVPAIKLTGLPGVFVDDSVDSVEYIHLLFDQHEIIFAERAPTESLFTGPEALKAIRPEAREEILTLFPEVAELDYSPEPARYIPPGKLQKQFVARHAKNNKPMLCQIYES